MTSQQSPCDACSIILVEDSPDEAELFSELLAAENIHVPITHFQDGQSALDYLLKCEQTDLLPRGLVVLDLNLPKLDGKEVLRRVNPDKWGDLVRVLVFSGSENPQDKIDCLASGAHGFYIKPWRFEQYSDFINGPLRQELQLVCPNV